MDALLIIATFTITVNIVEYSTTTLIIPYHPNFQLGMCIFLILILSVTDHNILPLLVWICISTYGYLLDGNGHISIVAVERTWIDLALGVTLKVPQKVLYLPEWQNWTEMSQEKNCMRWPVIPKHQVMVKGVAVIMSVNVSKLC